MVIFFKALGVFTENLIWMTLFLLLVWAVSLFPIYTPA